MFNEQYTLERYNQLHLARILLAKKTHVLHYKNMISYMQLG